MKCPCFNCEYRNYKCFCYCEQYQTWKAAIAEMKKPNVVQEYYNESYSRVLKARKRRK